MNVYKYYYTYSKLEGRKDCDKIIKSSVFSTEEKEELEAFNTMINGNKGYDCKTCRSDYNKAYATLNRQRIRDNERVRKGRAKINKTVKNGTIEYYKNSKQGTQTKEFPLYLCVKTNGTPKRWLICSEGLRWYDILGAKEN